MVAWAKAAEAEEVAQVKDPEPVRARDTVAWVKVAAEVAQVKEPELAGARDTVVWTKRTDRFPLTAGDSGTCEVSPDAITRMTFELLVDEHWKLGLREMTPFKGITDIGLGRLKKIGHGACILLFVGAVTCFAQTPAARQPKPSTVAAVDPNIQLLNQIAELRGQIAKLQAVTERAASRRKSSFNPDTNLATGGSPTMAKMGDKGEMSAMPSKDAVPAATGAIKEDQGEMNAMPAKGMDGVNGSSSAMPGQIGVSNLYHIGSTGFFLNHSQQITLTSAQTAALNRLKDQSILDQTLRQQSIDQKERELYALTGGEQPDTSTIEAKVGDIEKGRADRRMSFIRAVGESTKILTHDQQLVLTGARGAGKY